MPIYEFRCQQCREVFDFLLANLTDSRTLTCPVCGSQNLERLISAPSLLKGMAKEVGITCCGREERCETSPCSTGERCQRH